jgi:hypothetical protein
MNSVRKWQNANILQRNIDKSNIVTHSLFYFYLKNEYAYFFIELLGNPELYYN